ncbi:ubiquitin-protein ligase [Caldimonas brevitalea]|uniref:Ubiquitin-protein ligase n=1 Tax=Caldimonas brevitalea TaxID=413882 RepID=A0A0G3BIZ0_9BURK|nr:ubiquitin-protein ligase [Caldimonas brevitalea]
MRALDLQGLKRDTTYFLGYQFAAVALINLWPEEDTNYENDKKVGWESWRHNVTHPKWDDDRAVVNYILHPYWGAGYYVRARERGLHGTQALLYSALLSSIFEFGAEALVENVSYQDLLVTPLLGSLLGEHVFWPLRQRILAKQEAHSTADRVLLVLTDPLAALNAGVDRVLGRGVEVSLTTPLSPLGTSLRPCEGAVPHCLSGAIRGGSKPRWGVQLRLQW